MPYKNKEDTANAMARMRLKRKLAEAQQNPNDLNFGMKPIKDVFPSQDEWLEANPDKTPTDYIHLKIAWDRETVQNEQAILEEDRKEFRDTMVLEPFNPKCRATCITFRKAYLSFAISSMDWRIQNHNATCSFCGKWLASYTKNASLGSADLWGTESKAEDKIDKIKREQGWKLSCSHCGIPLNNDGTCPRCFEC
jgi:hypothetical protein